MRRSASRSVYNLPPPTDDRGASEPSLEITGSEAIRELEEQGVRCEEVRIDPHTGREIAFFLDPDEQPLELHHG